MHLKVEVKLPLSALCRPSLSDTIIPRLVTPFKNFYEKWSHEEKHIYVFFYKLLTELICYGDGTVVKMVILERIFY